MHAAQIHLNFPRTCGYGLGLRINTHALSRNRALRFLLYPGR